MANDLPARRLAEAFFDLCAEVVGREGDEAKVARHLRGRVLAAVERRNAYINGDWWGGWVSDEGQSLSAWQWSRDEATRLGAEELTTWTDEIAALRSELESFVQVSAGFGGSQYRLPSIASSADVRDRATQSPQAVA